MSAPGRAGRGTTVRAGRGIRVAAPSSHDVPPGLPVGEAGDDERTTPSPESAKFVAKVAQKSPSSSDGSPQGSPGATAARLASMRITEKLAEPEPIAKIYGNEGQSVPVSLNYVKVILNELSGPFLYLVRFYPPIDSADVMRAIMRSDSVTKVIGAVQVFTGMNVYLPKILPEEKSVIEVAYPNDPGQKVEVSIEYVKKPRSEELVMFYNNLLRRAMRELKLVQIKDHYFMPAEKIDIPQYKLQVWPGQVVSISDLDGGLLMLCEASHRVLRTNTALEMLQEMYREDSKNFRDNAKRRIIGNVILTRYNNKPYRVDDIDFDQKPTSTFKRNDGSEISYVDYFRKSWQLEIKDLGQPLLIHVPKPRKGETDTRRVTLIPELSILTGLTDDIRSDNRAMRDIATHTRIRPEVRYQKLLRFLQSLDQTPSAKKVFDDWNVRLDRKPVDINARCITQEQLNFGNSRKITAPENVSWSRDATGTHLLDHSDFTEWTVIYHQRDDAKVGDFVKLLFEVSKFMGFTIAMPRRQQLNEDNPTAYVNAIRSTVTKTTQLVLILTPGSSMREDRYSAIKKICCCDIAVPSQVVRIATASDQKKMKSVAQKVALQMQCKIGGAPWSVHLPFKAAMYVGIDAYHDPRKMGKSCLAIVSSMNHSCTKWFSKVYFQAAKEEISQTLNSAITIAMTKYKETMGVAPDRIFIFRDGVGDSQLSVVSSFEVPQVVAAATSFEDGLIPKVACVVVQKRVDMRMLLRMGNSFDNPKAGTILDREVTRKNYMDFFLISQHVTQGTVTPTHYIIVANQVGLEPDKMQRLTYKMTHLYYNWPGTVRVPAVCQYAHKLAYLAGQNLKVIPKESISDKLFFL